MWPCGNSPKCCKIYFDNQTDIKEIEKTIEEGKNKGLTWRNEDEKDSLHGGTNWGLRDINAFGRSSLWCWTYAGLTKAGHA